MEEGNKGRADRKVQGRAIERGIIPEARKRHLGPELGMEEYRY